MEHNAWMDRRGVLRLGLCAGALLIPAGTLAAQKDEKDEMRMTPVEDFSRDHGALDRIAIIYKEGLEKLGKDQDGASKTIRRAAELMKKLAGEYHQKEEEEHVFPLFEKSGQYSGLVRTLREQHDASRKGIARIIELTGQGVRSEGKQELERLIKGLNRMLEPHTAWEETVLFPAFQEKLGKAQYMKLTETLEKKEKEVLGSGGFESALNEIEAMEKELGIHDLNTFTAKV